MTGMAIDKNGRWDICHLTPNLQYIVRKHQDAFNGTYAAQSEV